VAKSATASKATLFGTAISILTAGTTLIRDNFNAGLACLIVGIVLLAFWSYLIDREARSEAVKAVEKAFKKLELELKGEKHES